MFHLLVAYEGWAEGSDTISNSRIYIKEKDELGKQFLTNGKLDITQLNKVPALLVTETGGTGLQFAKVAHIIAINQDSRDTEIQYAIDESIRPISNTDLEKYTAQLGISKSTLKHTHWEVNQADLFKILLLNQQKNILTPSVFNIESLGNQDSSLVSVMMPFQAEFNNAYDAIQTAVTSVGFNCVKANNFWKHDFIIQDIVDLIAKAKVVICDCSGRNPNVFYEAGIAHALGKEVILIAQSDHDVPFDLYHIRYVKYLNNGEGLLTLGKEVISRIQTLARYNL